MIFKGFLHLLERSPPLSDFYSRIIHFVFIQMSRDTEKWPTFEGAHPHGAKNGTVSGGRESLRPSSSLPFQEDSENSGMFTLKKKKDKEKKAQSQRNGALPRTNSTGSRGSDPSNSPRESQTSVQPPALF